MPQIKSKDLHFYSFGGVGLLVIPHLFLMEDHVLVLEIILDEGLSPAPAVWENSCETWEISWVSVLGNFLAAVGAKVHDLVDFAHRLLHLLVNIETWDGKSKNSPENQWSWI